MVKIIELSGGITVNLTDRVNQIEIEICDRFTTKKPYKISLFKSDIIKFSVRLLNMAVEA